MGDEKEGPYKVVSKLVPARAEPKFSIVMQKNHESFMTEIIPDAGTGSYARLVCNLLNKEHIRLRKETDDTPDGTDVAGVRYPD